MIQGFAVGQTNSGGGGGGITAINLSAGTTSNNLTAATFSNSNNVSFGLNGSTITASASFASTQGSVNISAGTTSNLASAFTFSNSNGVSFGLNASTLTASIATSLTNVNLSAGTTSNNLSAMVFSNSNNVSFGLNGSTVTASVTVASTQGSVNLSAGTTSNLASAFTFANSNLVTFGLNASTITVQHALNFSAGTTSNNVSSQLVFSNSNNVSFGLNGSTLTASATVASTQGSINLSAGTTSNIASAFTFANSNGVSFGLNASTVTASVATSLTNINLSAGTASNNLSAFVLSNSNNVSFGLNGSTVTATATVASSQGSVNISAGTTSTLAASFTFSNANGVSFGIGTGASAGVITASAAAGAGGVAVSNSQTLFSTGTVAFLEGGGAITIASSAGGQSLKFSVPQTSSLVGVAPISISTAGSTISVLLNQIASYWANLEQIPATTTTMVQSNTNYVFPLSLPFNLSASYLRFIGSFAFTSTTIATSAVNNASGASTAFSETVAWDIGLYSVGTGANSRKLQSIFSTSVGATWAVSVSQASTSNASQQSITQQITYPGEGFSTANTSTQYSVSATNGPVSTTQWTNFTAQRYLDIPFATSLSAGNYWMAVNRQSGTVGGKNLDWNASIYGVSNANLTWGNLGVATNLSNACPIYGVGVWTTNVTAVASSIDFASISATTSYMLPYIQFIRQA